MSRWPIFDVLPNRAFPPGECCFGTSPSLAEKSRPRRKDARSGAHVSIAGAVMGPTPGRVCARRAKSASFAAHLNFWSSTETWAFRPSICARYIRPRTRTSSGNAVALSSIASPTRLSCAAPLAATNPCSARCPRNALIIWVRWPTNIWPGAKQHRPGLVCLRLQRDKPHGGAQCCLDDRLGIGRIVLLTLHERHHIDRRDQAHDVSQFLELAAPAMCRGARLHCLTPAPMGQIRQIA